MVWGVLDLKTHLQFDVIRKLDLSDVSVVARNPIELALPCVAVTSTRRQVAMMAGKSTDLKPIRTL
jgi:hypothetical protein